MTGKLIIYWDFDAQWGAERSRSGGGSKQWGLKEFTNTERLLDLHAQAGIPACFAVVGSVALSGARPYHDPGLIRQISAAGHEIASHALKHEWIPALNRRYLNEILLNSKDALEQCTGKAVRSFVPPYNQPFDYPARGSFSLSERREAGRERTNIPGLCQALKNNGYSFARITYTSPLDRLKDWANLPKNHRAYQPEMISGITTLRLACRAGFKEDALQHVKQAIESGGYAQVYGHPHSLNGTSGQSEPYLLTFFEQVKVWVEMGLLEIVLPSSLCA